MMAELFLDSKIMNTMLAKEYLKTHNNFEPWPAHEKFWHVKLYPDDKNEYDVKNFEDIILKQNMTTMAPDRVKQLVVKIQENESLFCELESLIRQTDEVDVKRNLALIYQHLQCNNNSWNQHTKNHLLIKVDENTPLFALGSIAVAKSTDVKVSIVSTQKMAPLCYLFTKICSENGWSVPLIFTTDVQVLNTTSDVTYIVSADSSACACTGVVTETADIDSALYAFLSSSAEAPWRLRRIYVQENVYDQVKDAMQSRLFQARGKVFVYEGLGEGGIPVEAYRTSKELCALLQQQSTPALSLWAANAELAHEVALACPQPIIWINDYAAFHGPPVSCLPIYDQIYPTWQLKILATAENPFKTRRMTWRKLTKTQRSETIKNCLQTLKTTLPNAADFIESELQNLDENGQNGVVSVAHGKLCICLDRPALSKDIVNFSGGDLVAIPYSVNALINGAALFNSKSEKCRQFLEALEAAGVPVLWEYVEKLLHPEQNIKVDQRIIKKSMKVIRSNYGTVFAN